MIITENSMKVIRENIEKLKKIDFRNRGLDENGKPIKLGELTDHFK